MISGSLFDHGTGEFKVAVNFFGISRICLELLTQFSPVYTLRHNGSRTVTCSNNLETLSALYATSYLTIFCSSVKCAFDGCGG